MAYTNGGFGFGMKQPEPEWSPPAAAPPEEPPAFGERDVPEVPEGAEPPEAPEEPVVTVIDSAGTQVFTSEDTRVRILVPYKYLTMHTSARGTLGPSNLAGIIFPYTPSISFDIKADYASQNPLHSNFSINFYQKSSIGSISISGKFSVQNNDDAEVYMATVRLLKALTRMRSGGSTGDADSGAPPPICRLSAHGDAMLKNVPVVITSFRIELPDSVDYFTSDTMNGTNAVPTVSTIAITCLPMYSRNEMQQFSVTGYLANRHKGII